MRRRPGSPLGIAALALSLFLFASGEAAALDAAGRCRVTKLGAIAAATGAGLRCHVQAIRRGLAAAEPACLDGVDERLARAFARAERGGGCPPALAGTQSAVRVFVAARAGEAVPGPTPTPMPSPGCGNGATEPGESCDGGTYCDPSCSFAFPDLCCSFAPVCIAVADVSEADQCFLAGGTPRLGTRCVTADPQCEEGTPCVGSCEPTSFPATAFCCDGGSGCTESTLSDTEALSALLVQCGAGAVVQGACVAGSCVPGG